MRRIVSVVALCSLAVAPSAALARTKAVASPGAGALVLKESRLSVKETIDALAKAVEAKGLKIVARVDHAAGAKAAAMELPPTELLIFGNPQLGTPLMQSNPLMGLELPMRVLAYTDKSGKVMIAYTSPQALKARTAIKDRDPQFQAMTAALDALTTAATAGK